MLFYLTANIAFENFWEINFPVPPPGFRPTFCTPQTKCLMLQKQSQKCSSLPAMLLFTQYETTWTTAISGHCLAALPAKDVCVQQSHAAKRPLPQCEVNICCHVIVRNKDQ